MEQASYLYVVDSIDDAGSAVLRREDGLTFPVPLHWLPENVQPGQRLAVRAEGGTETLTLQITSAARAADLS